MHIIGVVGTVICTLFGVFVLKLAARIAAKLLSMRFRRCGIEGCWRRGTHRFHDGNGPWFFMCDRCVWEKLGPSSLKGMIEKGIITRVAP